MSSNPTPSATLYQTYAVSGQVGEPHGNLARSGPVDQAMFYRWTAATVTYKLATGGQTYTDTIAALTPARVYRTTKTTVDLRASRYVVFTEPQRGGAATLWIADEGYYNFLAQQGYVIPLDYCWWDGMQIYQNTAGVAMPPPGGSMSGGGVLGALTAQSMTGGGIVAGQTFQCGAQGHALGFYLWLQALPSVETVLWDFDGGAGGYYRITVTPTGIIQVKYNLPSGAGTGVIQINPSNAIAAGQWNWITSQSTARNDAAGNPTGAYLNLAVYGQAGALLNQIQQQLLNAGGPVSISCRLGIGVPCSGTEAPFPNAASSLMSKLRFNPHGGGQIAVSSSFSPFAVIAPPLADFGTGAGLVYNCRDGVGAVAQLADTSGNNVPLPAGAQGLTVLAQGPYA